MPNNIYLWTNPPKSNPILAKIKLKRIIRYSQRAWESEDQAEAFKLAVRVAYYLDDICDPNKANYVKNEKQKNNPD